MFKATSPDARLWRYIIDATSALIDEGTLEATPEGVKMRAMDPSHVAMIDFDLPKAVFEEYSCDSETKMGINLGELSKVIKRAKALDALELELDEEKNKLKVRFKGAATRTFSLGLLDLSEEELPTPSIEFNAEVGLEAEILKDAIKDAEVVSDHINISADEKSLIIDASGDTGDLEVVVPKESCRETSIKEESKSMYSINYLVEMMKAIPAADPVQIQFSTDMPIQIDFKIPGGGRITYFLAPRIETE